MGLLSGSLSLSRYHIPSLPPEPDFERAAFRELLPGSEVREHSGFVPMEPDAPYQVGAARYAFRLRVDTLRPDATAVAERVKGLVKSEQEMSGLPVGPKKRRKLKDLAEEELLSQVAPRSKIIECCIDGKTLHVASTAKAYLGKVTELLRKVGIAAEHKAPWLDRGDPDIESQIVETYEPGESVWGCRFLKALVSDREILIEPEAGFVRLQTPDARVTLAGAVRSDLHRYLERDAEILAAKLLTAETSFRLDGLSFRISSLKVETTRHDHWSELLDERLENIGNAWEMLDEKYAQLFPQMRGQ